MKKLVFSSMTLLFLTCSSSWLAAQEYDDVYFTAKDRKQTSYSNAVVAQPTVLSSGAQTLANDPVKSKFANPEFREGTGHVSILPYFRKDYNNAFTGAFRNWNATGSCCWNSAWNFGSTAFWGFTPFLTSRWNWGFGPLWATDPWVMNRMMLWGWNDPWLVNRMMMWDPFWNPSIMTWSDPFLTSRMMMWDPFWGANPFFRPVVIASTSNVQHTSRADRSNVYTPIRPRAEEYFQGGRLEESSAVRSSRYGNFDNSSAGRSAYIANEYNSGRSGYAGQSEWAPGRASSYETRQYNSGFDSHRSSGFGSFNSGRMDSFGGGSYGGSTPRSIGGCGGRDN